MSRVFPEQNKSPASQEISPHFWSPKRLLLSTPRSTKWSLDLSIPIKTLYTSLLSPIRATYPAHLILLDLNARIIFYVDYRP